MPNERATDNAASEIYYTLSDCQKPPAGMSCRSCENCSCFSGHTAFSTSLCNNSPRSQARKPSKYYELQDNGLVLDRCRIGRRNEYHVMKGYVTLCCVAALMALLSILLLHAMSSIWLDPLRNMHINEEFMYITVALAAASASLNFCALATFGIQIYLVYTDNLQDVYRMLRYLMEVSTIRFVASFSVFISIPLFMTSFACYIYMEFTRMAALIAMSIMGVAVVFIVFSVAISYYKWDQTKCSVSGPYNTTRSIMKNSHTTPSDRAPDNFLIAGREATLPRTNVHANHVALREYCQRKRTNVKNVEKSNSSVSRPSRCDVTSLKTDNGLNYRTNVTSGVVTEKQGAKSKENASNQTQLNAIENQRKESKVYADMNDVQENSDKASTLV